MTPRLFRSFNKGFYAGTGRWSHHSKIIKQERSVHVSLIKRRTRTSRPA
jgi:hypothetical protein